MRGKTHRGAAESLNRRADASADRIIGRLRRSDWRHPEVSEARCVSRTDRAPRSPRIERDDGCGWRMFTSQNGVTRADPDCLPARVNTSCLGASNNEYAVRWPIFQEFSLLFDVKKGFVPHPDRVLDPHFHRETASPLPGGEGKAVGRLSRFQRHRIESPVGTFEDEV